ncbi:MAG: hypothetical protein AB1598_03270 [Thermodesulfobacteriota bacterium]
MPLPGNRALVNTIVLILTLLSPLTAEAEEVLNLGPLLYIDRDEQSGTKSIDALGPFVSYKKTPDTVEYGFRPVFYNYRDYAKDRTAFDFLYPLMTHRTFEGDTKFQLLEYLFYYSSDLRPSGFREYSYMLFPLVFGRKDEDPRESYFALFPLYGRMRHKFGKDEVNFVLFPLFLQTREGGATNNNFLWPFIGAYSGGGVSGGRFWPIYGWRGKEGDFEDEFALWPIYMHRERDFYGEKLTSTALLPFYYGTDAPGRKQRTYLWPFVNVIDDANTDVRRWDIPWPLVTFSRGTVDTNRIFPFYSLRKEKDYEAGFVMWPAIGYKKYVFKDYVRTKRTFGLFILKDITETPTNGRGKSSKAVHFWPLFSYRTTPDGVSTFHLFSLIETFLPDNPPRERNWSPFWQLAVWRMDAEGNQMSSILWNTIRTERTKDKVKFELRPIIPVISFEKSEETSKFYLVGGLLGWKSTPEKKTLRILFIPVTISTKKSVEETGKGSGG